MGELAIQEKPRLELSGNEQALICGNLASLTDSQRLELYGRTCEVLGLNPLTRPFEYIVLNDKLTLYARRDCTDQLRRIHSVSVSIVNRELIDGVYVVTARATTPDGRSDESTGAVALVKETGKWETAQSGKRFFKGDGTYVPINPEDRANKLMTAETKAKRRVTLSICGLGFLDETEVESVVHTGAARHPQHEAQGEQQTTAEAHQAQAPAEQAPAPALTPEQKKANAAEMKKRLTSMGYEGDRDALLRTLLNMTDEEYKQYPNNPKLVAHALTLGPNEWNAAVDALFVPEEKAA